MTLFLSMLPIAELRGGLPYAYFVAHYPIEVAFIVTVLANLVPIPFIIKFFHFFESWLRNYPKWAKFFDWLDRRTRKRVKKGVEKYGAAGLWIFVAIPLPVTGAWTGAFAAYIFDMEFKRAMAAIVAGVLTAGLIVMGFCLWIPKLVGHG